MLSEMVKCRFLICEIVLLTVLKPTKCDQALSHILKNETVFGMAPKLWHQYVKSFLYQVIAKSHFFTVEQSFCHLDNDVGLFLQYSQKRWLKPIQPNYTLIITGASGRLELVDVGIYVYFAVKKHYPRVIYLPHVSYTWILQMDVSLRAHLKFATIYFPLSPYDCKKGNVTIFQNFPTFVFCGQMATLFLYPSSP